MRLNLKEGKVTDSSTEPPPASVLTSRKSKKKVLKVYLKFVELQNEIFVLERELSKRPNDNLLLQRLNILKNSKLHAYASSLIRFEARLKKDWLRRQDIPLNLKKLIQLQKDYESQGKCLITELWQKSFADLLTALDGQGVNMTDHEKVFGSGSGRHGG